MRWLPQNRGRLWKISGIGKLAAVPIEELLEPVLTGEIFVRVQLIEFCKHLMAC
jgi:hypothetical protein